MVYGKGTGEEKRGVYGEWIGGDHDWGVCAERDSWEYGWTEGDGGVEVAFYY